MLKALFFFGDRSSLHGVGYVFSPFRDSWFKRIFWMAILALCGFGASIMLLSSLRLYWDVAMSFSVETNYLDWKTPFPAFSVCESGSPERIKEYLASFVPTKTEYGVCYTFNSKLPAIGSKILTVSHKTGLSSLVFTASDTVWIKIHAPDEVVSVMMDNVLGSLVSLPFVADLEVILKAEQTVSDLSVYTLPPEVRRCLHGRERPRFADKWPFKNYSYSACILYCRAMSQYEYCNCTHHFMPHMVNIPVCDVNGLSCLNKNRESLENPACNCPMGCEEISYKLVHRFFTRHSVNKTLAARGTRGIIRLAQLPSLRVRRLAIRDTLGLVVDIGGVGGVFFGASLLSVIECIYLLFLRRR